MSDNTSGAIPVWGLPPDYPLAPPPLVAHIHPKPPLQKSTLQEILPYAHINSENIPPKGSKKLANSLLMASFGEYRPITGKYNPAIPDKDVPWLHP